MTEWRPNQPAAPAVSSAVVWRFANAMLDEASLVLRVAGQKVRLERRPLDLLLLLLRHAGEVVTKDEIMEAVWTGQLVGEASLTKCVARLRAVLGDTEQTIICTAHRIGYRLDAGVTMALAAPAAIRPAALDLHAGEAVARLPGWHLVRRLGTGGFGDAWLAEEAGTGECKVLKFAADAPRLAALRREVTLYRLLNQGLGQRGDIVPVQGWNFAEPPYFVELPWCREGNLAEWFARQAPVPALGTRLALAVGIADALAAAHSMGVLHKDLKPANILIKLDAEGVPRVALSDFGSGRVLDPGRLDRMGITRMEEGLTTDSVDSFTMLYRAPEFTAGRSPTVQADIYALGVILYQLVVADLSRPLAPGWEHDVADPLLREDIAAAAAGDPARRLPDASLLAQRLRTLERRRAAELAAREAEAEAGRLRHALDLAGARRAPLIGAVAALALGLVASLLLDHRANQAERQASASAKRAEAVTDFVSQGVLSAANPFLAADPAIRVRDLLGPAAADLDRRFTPGSLDAAAIGQVIGRAYAGLSDAAHARPLLERVLATRRAALGETDAQTVAVRLDLMDLAEHELDLGQMKAQGEAILRAAPLPAETELRARYEVALAQCQTTGNAESCAAPLAPLLEEARRRLGLNADTTLKIAAERAFALADGDHTEAAVSLARDTLARTEARFGASHPRTLEARFLLSECLSGPTQAGEAIALLSQVRAGYLALSGHETHASIRAANQLARAYFNAGRFVDALPLFRMVVERDVAERGEGFSESLNALNNLANTLDALKQHSQAIAIGQRAVAIQSRVTSADHPDTLWFENNLALFYEHSGQLPDAERLYRDAFERARRTQKPTLFDAGHFAYHLGVVLGLEGKTDEARAVLSDSVARLGVALGAGNVRTQRAGAALAKLGK